MYLLLVNNTPLVRDRTTLLPHTLICRPDRFFCHNLAKDIAWPALLVSMAPGALVIGEVEVAGIDDVTEAQWAGYLKKLTLRAGYLFMAYGWGTRGRWMGPGGVTPNDVAADAIVKTLDGTRRYDPEQCPSLIAFLRHTVRSLVSHIAEAPATQRRREMVKASHGDDCPVTLDPIGDEPDPLENCICRETVDILKKAAEQEKDDLIVRILECLEVDITKPSDVAELLDVDVNTINNAQKRLRRRAKKLLLKQKREEP